MIPLSPLIVYFEVAACSLDDRLWIFLEHIRWPLAFELPVSLKQPQSLTPTAAILWKDGETTLLDVHGGCIDPSLLPNQLVTPRTCELQQSHVFQCSCTKNVAAPIPSSPRLNTSAML